MLKQHGISLLEVLAALFVVSIGLLGVLAVIPFGAFQVSKAQHAEYASNMLANAAEEIFIRDMTNPQTWNSPSAMVDPSKFMWIESHGKNKSLEHISCVGDDFMPPQDRWNPPGDKPEDWISSPSEKHWMPPNMWWKELMRGRDDLVYNTYDDKRPDFRKNKDDEVVIQSSGKYTWFFTFLPQPGTVTVDILACYNRVPEDEDDNDWRGNASFVPSLRGGTFEFPARHLERLAQTKYVFATWMDASELKGVWCKIVFLDKDELSNPRKPKIVVTGDLPDVSKNMYVYIPSGVLYRKQEQYVPIR